VGSSKYSTSGTMKGSATTASAGFARKAFCECKMRHMQELENKFCAGAL
jgi:hypothetical protein